MKRFASNNPNSNPFDNITDEQFKVMIEEGFELSTLGCYADLKYSGSSPCYKKFLRASNDWLIMVYINKYGIAVDYDYDCGGNSSNNTWWIKEFEYEKTEFNYGTYKYDTETVKTYPLTFEQAWDEMIDYVNKL